MEWFKKRLIQYSIKYGWVGFAKLHLKSISSQLVLISGIGIGMELQYRYDKNPNIGGIGISMK